MPAPINDGRPFHLRDHASTGLRYREVHEACRRGLLRRVLKSVYVDATTDDTRALRLQSLALVAPLNAFVADEWAAWLYGLDVFTPTQRHQMIPTVLVPHGQSRMRSDTVRCRQAKIDARDLIDLGPLAITTPVRTTSDLLRKRWRPYALSAADAMVHERLVAPNDVVDFVARLKGYPGIVQARSLSYLLEPAAASPGESWLRLRILDAGFPRPVAQWPVVDVNGVQRYADLAYPERQLVIEYDGREHHTGVDDVQHDDDRRTAVTARGLRAVVARREDVFGDDPAFEQELGELLGMEPLARRW